MSDYQLTNQGVPKRQSLREEGTMELEERSSTWVECPDAEVCQSCRCAGEDDVCFPHERAEATESLLTDCQDRVAELETAIPEKDLVESYKRLRDRAESAERKLDELEADEPERLLRIEREFRNRYTNDEGVENYSRMMAAHAARMEVRLEQEKRRLERLREAVEEIDDWDAGQNLDYRQHFLNLQGIARAALDSMKEGDDPMMPKYPLEDYKKGTR